MLTLDRHIGGHISVSAVGGLLCIRLPEGPFAQCRGVHGQLRLKNVEKLEGRPFPQTVPFFKISPRNLPTFKNLKDHCIIPGIREMRSTPILGASHPPDPLLQPFPSRTPGSAVVAARSARAAVAAGLREVRRHLVFTAQLGHQDPQPELGRADQLLRGDLQIIQALHLVITWCY